MTYSLGIDIGGTFTDVVLYSHDDARVFSHKELTTPEEPTIGAIRGIRTLLDREQVSGSQISRVVHATTLFTNALIERRGVKTGLITTEGFRDTLEMRREFKYDLYDLFIEMPSVLVPREARLEARERVRADGSVVTPLDEASVIAAGKQLVDQGIESVAVVFLHAYANPAHERQARDILKREFPKLYVSISSEVAPQIREYERTSTTTANAYVLPIADQYLGSFEGQLKEIGIGCPMLMMLSNGGLTHVGEARRFPVQLLESGPAAGAIAAAWFSKRSGIENVLAFDMGGTTAKLAIVENNKPILAHSFEAAREKRFATGSGLPINIATVELIEIGAGGGSIAHLDSMNLLKVGPKSASSRPGPACYKRGGTLPTVTDANLLLGHLDPTTFAGGTMQLSPEAATDALAPIAGPLGTGTEKTADGVLAIVNENMAAAARVHVAERGFDAHRFALLVTGGGGPLHGCDVARRLGIKRVICPPGAGVASALGLLIAPARVDRSTTLAKRLSTITADALEAAYTGLESAAASVMKDTLVQGAKYRFERSADIRFVGQGFELNTRLPEGPFTSDSLQAIRDAFAEGYGRVFGQVPPVQDIELMNLRVAAIEEGVDRPLNLAASGKETWKHGVGNRDVWQPAREAFQNVQSVPLAALVDRVDGPAIVEDASSTLVIPADAVASRDTAGNLIVDLV
ncbi:hydantoinase/oxoprolinase family protein [Cupriavidus taiwanensis]|uniref:Hydantoinase n=1 Tax=Cupriavidus taiwanensis TaxID=164546 RepID=A0A7Z7NQ52_9BURK|nr:hydantoinase/oxoprolinase family protein [Cupriavidus taiwanensis]SOZ17194.1 Hydantoinase [Cupriavidus taiwanensis]SOZ96480.1 Hydantoinase [Cupriavidus taiwanensis]SPC25577.1 Hydantoinase [Cupriavidus taiwanensis]